MFCISSINRNILETRFEQSISFCIQMKYFDYNNSFSKYDVFGLFFSFIYIFAYLFVIILIYDQLIYTIKRKKKEDT